jgi:hypothetical protein
MARIPCGRGGSPLQLTIRTHDNGQAKVASQELMNSRILPSRGSERLVYTTLPAGQT